MIQLHPCSGCDRHVRADERACPFCGAELSTPPPVPRRRPGRFTRAAIFAGATALASACGNGGAEEEPVDTENDVTVGDETDGMGDDGYVDDQTYDEGNDGDDGVEEIEHAQPMPYGAPPVRERLV